MQSISERIGRFAGANVASYARKAPLVRARVFLFSLDKEDYSSV